MKKFLLIWSIILLAVIFQTSLLAPWFADYFYPDLMLVFVILAVVNFGFHGTWIWAVLAGFTMDIFAYSIPGTHVIIFSLAAYAVSFISWRFSVADKGLGIIFIIILMPAITALDFWGVPMLQNTSLENRILTLQSLYSIGVVALENIILFFVFYPLFLRLKKYYSPAQFRLSK